MKNKYEPEDQLTEFELQQVPYVMNVLKARTKKEDMVTVNHLLMHYKNIQRPLAVERLNMIIRHIRLNEKVTIGGRKYFVLSNSVGFWLSCDMDEVKRFSDAANNRSKALNEIYEASMKFLGITGTEIKQSELF